MSRHEFRVHGGPHDDELRTLGVNREKVLDFSANTNPYGPCPAVVEAIRSAAIDRYPDPTAMRAREALAAHLECSPDGIVLGNGAADLLWTLVHVLLSAESKALIVEPTFCEFRAACVAFGIPVIEWRSTQDTAFSVDLAAVGNRAAESGAKVVYLCTPNTPTGTLIPALAVVRWAEANPGLTVILDQSFLSLSERSADSSVRMPANVVCVRSMTKDHAIPGVRLGYAVAAPEIVASIGWHRPEWTTNALAQAACIEACRQSGFIDDSRERILDDCRQMIRELQDIGLHPFHSTTIFLLVRAGAVAELRARLLGRHAILVRDCASFGLPDCMRLAARPAGDRARLIAALREELPQCKHRP